MKLATAELTSSSNQTTHVLELEMPNEYSGSIQVQLARHDEIDVHWIASCSCAQREGNKWTGDCRFEFRDENDLIEVSRLEDEAGAAIAFNEPLMFFRTSPDQCWEQGEAAAIARAEFESQKRSLAEDTVGHPEARQDSPVFEVLLIAENLLISRSMMVPGLQIHPIQNATQGGTLNPTYVLEEAIQHWSRVSTK